MNLSALLRIVRIPTCQRVMPHYGSTLIQTSNRVCTRNLSATSCFVHSSPTNFRTDGTGGNVKMNQIANAAVRSVYFRHARYLETPITFCLHERTFSTSHCRHKKEEITVNFLNRDGETLTVKAKVGETLLDTVIDNDVDIDGFGACEGTLACSTCHLIFDEEIFETLPEKLDEEEDMLDLAYGLEDTSRLGCQICLTKEMDNMTVSVPEGINDARDV